MKNIEILKLGQDVGLVKPFLKNDFSSIRVFLLDERQL